MQMEKRKLAIIGTVGLPANYGGFETLAGHLVEDLGNKYQISVYCSARKYPKNKRSSRFKGARLIWLPFDANGVQSIIYDCISILHAVFYADVLLVLGVSGGFLLPFVRWFTRKKIITSIDGIEWKRSKWSKIARLYLWMAEWMAVYASHSHIADNEAIQDYTAVRYQKRSAIIEYGSDHTLHVKPTETDKKTYPFLRRPYAFKVCRIEPENNVEMILEAFSSMPLHPLVLVGNWKNSEFGLALKQKYSSFPNLHLLDAIYEQQQLDMLRGNALLYIHGHSAGGTNPSLVEAMYLGLPVAAYGVTYNKATTEHKAIYFKSREELIQLVKTTSVASLRQVGERMQEISMRRYTWKMIASKYCYLIENVLAANDRFLLIPAISRQLSYQYLLQQEMAHIVNPDFFYEKR